MDRKGLVGLRSDGSRHCGEDAIGDVSLGGGGVGFVLEGRLKG